MGTAADAYAARVDAVNAQRARIHGERHTGARWERLAANFRMDPHRALDPNLEIVAAYVQPEDVLIDVGGGAGRVGLPLALRCREVVNVEPSARMGAEFEQAAAEAGITNVRLVPADWLSAEGVEGDVTLAVNVTYFIRDIVPFVEKLMAAARRRVMITVWSVPPPAQDAHLFRLLYGEDQEMAPGHRELLPVLWEMGILPDVRVLPDPFRPLQGLPRTREQAVSFALERVEPPDPTEAAKRIEAEFDALFARRGEVFVPRWRPDTRELLITWETAEAQ